jgi:hypothetical protein
MLTIKIKMEWEMIMQQHLKLDPMEKPQTNHTFMIKRLLKIIYGC